MPVFALASALAAPPRPLDPSLLPAFPKGFEGRVHEVCDVELLTQEDGREEVLTLEGCHEPFLAAIRDRLRWWTWRFVDAPVDDLLDRTHAVLTAPGDVPVGLYTRFQVVFEKGAGDVEPTVAFVPVSVVELRKKSRIDLPADVAAQAGAGCDLVMHVSAEGRVVRVQTESCADAVQAAVELPTMLGWTFEELRLAGEPKAFAVRLHVAGTRPGGI